MPLSASIVMLPLELVTSAPRVISKLSSLSVLFVCSKILFAAVTVPKVVMLPFFVVRTRASEELMSFTMTLSSSWM